MKTKLSVALNSAAVIVLSTNIFASTATNIPLPSGWISASQTLVQEGTQPLIKWSINYPSVVKNVVKIQEPGTIVAIEDIDCEVRILGAGVTTTYNNGSSFVFVPTEAQLKYANQSYQRIFFGTNNDVVPGNVVWSGSVAKNKALKFGGRYKFNNNWGPYFNSDSGTKNIRILVNGDAPPSKVPDYNAPSLESFIKPYLNASNKVSIGPMDCIIFMELTHTDSQSSNVGYDLQDMVLLVTFKSVIKSNNGHGNNLDGIDSSNPGNAPFINLDTNPNVDDER